LKAINPDISIKTVTGEEATKEFISEKKPNPPIVAITDKDDKYAILASIYSAYKDGVILFIEGGKKCSEIEKDVENELNKLKGMGLDINLKSGKDQYLVYFADGDTIPVRTCGSCSEGPSCDYEIADTKGGIFSDPEFGFGRFGLESHWEMGFLDILSMESAMMMRGVFYDKFTKTNRVLSTQECESFPCQWTNGCFKDCGKLVKHNEKDFSSYDFLGFIETYNEPEIEKVDVFINYAHGGGIIPSFDKRWHSTIFLNIGCNDKDVFVQSSRGILAYLGSTEDLLLMGLPFKFKDFASGKESIGRCIKNNLGKKSMILFGDPTIKLTPGSRKESKIYDLEINPSSLSYGKSTQSLKYKPTQDMTDVTLLNGIFEPTEHEEKIDCPNALAGEEKECKSNEPVYCLWILGIMKSNEHELGIIRSIHVITPKECYDCLVRKYGNTYAIRQDYCIDGIADKCRNECS